MNNLGSDRYLRAIIVGRDDDEFACFTMNRLGDYGVEFLVCEDVYQAVGELAKMGGGNVLVVGRYEQLRVEKGRFFEKISENGFSCGCLLNTCSMERQREIESAVNGAVFVIKELEEIGDVITELLTEVPAVRERKDADKSDAAVMHFEKNGFAATKAELDALLGYN